MKEGEPIEEPYALISDEVLGLKTTAIFTKIENGNLRRIEGNRTCLVYCINSSHLL